MKNQLAEDLMDVFRKHAKTDEGYYNPYFCSEVTEKIFNYYEIEDEMVDDWIQSQLGK